MLSLSLFGKIYADPKIAVEAQNEWKNGFLSANSLYSQHHSIFRLSGFSGKEPILRLGRCFFKTVLARKYGVEYLNQKKPMIIDELAFLSVKHSVYVSELFQALVSARKSERSTCMELVVQYRGSIKGKAIFLITKSGKVLVQFRVPEDFLLRKDICFETWMNTDRVRKQISRQNLEPQLSMMVQDLRHGMRKINVEAKVLENPKPSPVFTRYGTSAMVTNAWIADETGKVKLCLWNDQADCFAKGDTIQIRNASVSTFRGERQLCLGKTGTISVLQRQAPQTRQEPELITKN